MTATRDREREREELLRQIESALRPEVQHALNVAHQVSQGSKVLLLKNEVGTNHADQG